MSNPTPKISPVHIRPDTRIEICIPSRGRTPNLSCMLQALRTQSFESWDLTIVDDNPDDSLRSDFTLSVMFQLLETEGHRCRVIHGRSQGLASAHDALLMATRKPLIARIDDDTLPARTDYLALLFEQFVRDSTGRLGAVGGPIPHFTGGPLEKYAIPDQTELDKYAPFEAPFTRYLPPRDATPHTVTTLYSSFLYKTDFARAAGGFPVAYGLVGEKEDTDTLTRIAFLGAPLVFHPQALLWHLKVPAGGTRSFAEFGKEQTFQDAYRQFVLRMKSLKERTFDWSAEATANLEPYRSLGALPDDARGYIEP